MSTAKGAAEVIAALLAQAGLGLPVDRPFGAVDLIDGSVNRLSGRRIPIDLDPATAGARIFWLRPT